MTEIARHPEVKDYIIESDWVPGQPASEGLVDLYEDGHLIVLRRFRLDLDFEFIASISYDADLDPQIQRIFKKYPLNMILEMPSAVMARPALPPVWWRIVGPPACRLNRLAHEHLRRDPVAHAQRLFIEQVFGGDRGRFRYFQGQVWQAHEQVIGLFHSLFPHYSAAEVSASWRLSESQREGLHWDTFKERQDFHQVRIFANLDSRPRIWRTSHLVELYVRSHERAAELAAKAASMPPNHFTRLLDKPIPEHLPCHEIRFEQGDVWLVETRIVSHEIFWGRRALAYMFYIDPTTMHAPERSFNRRIERLRTP